MTASIIIVKPFQLVLILIIVPKCYHVSVTMMVAVTVLIIIIIQKCHHASLIMIVVLEESVKQMHMHTHCYDGIEKA